MAILICYRSRCSGDVFGGGVWYLDPEGQVECNERLSLPMPKPRRAQKETNLQKEVQINNCSPGSSPSAGCAAAVAAPLMNNAGHKES